MGRVRPVSATQLAGRGVGCGRILLKGVNRLPKPSREKLLVAMIKDMKLDHESAAQWCERALVANSLAAAQEEALAGAGNPTAVRVARKRAAAAEDELQLALTALQAEREREPVRPFGADG